MGATLIGVQFVPVADMISHLLLDDNPSCRAISSVPIFTVTDPLVNTNELLATKPVDLAGNVTFSFERFTDI